MPETVLTADAVDYLNELERTFGPRRRELLAARHERAQRLLDGELPDFLPESWNPSSWRGLMTTRPRTSFPST